MASRFTTEQIQRYQAFLNSLPNVPWKNFGSLDNFIGLTEAILQQHVPLEYLGIVLTHWRTYQSLFRFYQFICATKLLFGFSSASQSPPLLPPAGMLF
jgi:hypothetical protein